MWKDSGLYSETINDEEIITNNVIRGITFFYKFILKERQELIEFY